MKTRNSLALSLSLLTAGFLLASGCQPGANLVGDLNPSPSPSPSASAEGTPDPNATQPPAPTPAPLGQLATLAGNGAEGSTDATGTSASFRYPVGIALYTDGSFLVADQRNHAIRQVTPDGVVTTFAGIKSPGFLDKEADYAKFDEPMGVAVGPDGKVYVADMNNHRIRVIGTDAIVSTLAGSGTKGFQDGDAATAQFEFPAGVAVDASGSVYVADSENHRIRVIRDGQVSTLAGSAPNGFEDGDGATAKFGQPYGLCVDAQGNVYVADYMNNAIRKVTPSGQVTTVAGRASSGSDDGDGLTKARFNKPRAVILGADNHLYVADAENHKIRRIAPDGTVATVAGSGDYGFAPTGKFPTSALQAQFKSPVGLVQDANGSIFITDLGNHAIRRLY